MNEHQDFEISGPPFDVELSPVDKVAPPIYSQRILIFSRENHNHEGAILTLKLGLQSTVNEILILGGQMGVTSAGWFVKNGGHALLRIKHVEERTTQSAVCCHPPQSAHFPSFSKQFSLT